MTDQATGREERALLMLGIAVGGKLSLVGANLHWSRSAYGALGIILDKGPANLEIWLGDLVALKGGRKPPWTEIVLCLLTWGLFIPMLLLRPTLWLGPLDLILMALNGSYRRTLEIRTHNGNFYFSIRNVTEWLAAIDEAAKRHNAGSPVIFATEENS